MRREFDSAAADRDWLTHRWNFRIRDIGLIAWKEPWEVEADGCTISCHATQLEAEAWVERFEQRSLDDVIAAHADLLPLVIVIEAGSRRLARVPEPLWGTYDAIDLTYSGRLSVLSAKARAMFPQEDAVFIRGYTPGDRNLRTAPKPKPVRVA